MCMWEQHTEACNTQTHILAPAAAASPSSASPDRQCLLDSRTDQRSRLGQHVSSRAVYVVLVWWRFFSVITVYISSNLPCLFCLSACVHSCFVAIIFFGKLLILEPQVLVRAKWTNELIFGCRLKLGEFWFSKLNTGMHVCECSRCLSLYVDCWTIHWLAELMECKILF